MRRILVGTLALAALAGAPALAHHSGAMFDRSREISVSGVVKEFQYTNPHSWLMVTVEGADGKQVQWGFEAEGPSTLLRSGIKRSAFTPGEKVTVRTFPLRDGRPAGALINVTRADGSVVYFRGGPPPAAPGR